MECTCTPFDERAEPNPDGTFDWIYRGDILTFRDHVSELSFRRYSDEPHVYLLVGSLQAAAADPDLLQMAAAHLRSADPSAAFDAIDPTIGSYAPASVAVSSARLAGVLSVSAAVRVQAALS